MSLVFVQNENTDERARRSRETNSRPKKPLRWSRNPPHAHTTRTRQTTVAAATTAETLTSSGGQSEMRVRTELCFRSSKQTEESSPISFHRSGGSENTSVRTVNIQTRFSAAPSSPLGNLLSA